ncbi:MAG TPA: hypothetical protein VL307_04880, partial [Chitinophagaceae bacterium]|nr:hypothetical protein [Chitinophagaceae bacterium]
MQTSQEWIGHFRHNIQQQRINWQLAPTISAAEKKSVLKGLQGWQLGETSDGAHLLAAANNYASAVGDTHYYRAVQWFIKEEQKHGANLGRYLDAIGEERLQHHWTDWLFRKVRYFNTSMECWTLAVVTVESTAQVFYQSLKDATNCALLQQICTDILIDEAYHIDFQMQRLASIFARKTVLQKIICFQLYRFFYFSTILVVWLAYHQTFRAGNNHLPKYFRKMQKKFGRTIQRLHRLQPHRTKATSPFLP